MTAITADPVSILRGAPHMALAQEFALWLLSPDAQGLWQRRCDVPNGPEKYELRRQPIRRDIYTPQEMATWVDRINPFEIASVLPPAPPGVPRMLNIVGPLSHAMAIDILDDLQAAQAAIEDHPNHPRIAETQRLFDALPPDLVEVWPPTWNDDLKKNWSAILADKNDPRRPAVLATPAASLIGVFIAWGRDPDRRLIDQARWTRFFRANYAKVVELAGQ
jgi:hypothetical protein